jgi:hypothetical protein
MQHITLQQTRDDDDDDSKRINSTRNRLTSMMVHLLPDSRVVGHLRAQPAPSEENEQRDARLIARIVAGACQLSACASALRRRHQIGSSSASWMWPSSVCSR